MDFLVENHGSICVLQPLTSAAVEWCDANLPEDCLSWGGGVVVEPRYIDDIVEGIRGDGLTVE